MAEKTVLVCDQCGQPAKQTVTLQVGSRRLLKDLCTTHLSALTENTRKPRRGRRPGSTNKTSTRRAASGNGRRRRRSGDAAAGEETASSS